MSLPTFTSSRQLEALTHRCVQCGFCNATCPTYLDSGEELEGPRGRIRLIRAMSEGEQVSRRTQQHLDHCLTCLACETTCPSGVRYREIIDLGRSHANHIVGRTLGDTVFRELLLSWLESPRLLGATLRGVRWIRGWIPRRFRPYLAPPRRLDISVPRSDCEGPTVLLVAGCIQRHLAPSFDDALSDLLRVLGYRVERMVASSCCGAVSQHLGETARAGRQIELIRAAIRRRLAKDSAVEAVVMTSSGCGLWLFDALKDTPEGQATRRGVIDPLSLLEPHVDVIQKMLQPRPQPDAPVVVHEPCSLRHGFGEPGRLSRFLRAAGLEVRNDKGGSLCCGAGGTHALFYPELAGRLRDEKREALGLNQGFRAVSSNIGCILHLGDAAEIDHWLCALVKRLDLGRGEVQPEAESLHQERAVSGRGFG